MGKPLPRWERPSDYMSQNEQYKMLIMDLLRSSVIPLTRDEIAAALGWPDSVLRHNNTVGPLILLQTEGKVGKIQDGLCVRYYADPDISKLIT